ncbi:hypothetical protein, partial [Paraglaciecola sp. MB-3u-78]|uniref:hypothetical protein n=1 Tax=Paraglaciecola sp. MB-3u-78 TaxID=2058332 RepID=UPI001E441127
GAGYGESITNIISLDEWLLHNLLANYERTLHNRNNWYRWFWLYHSRHSFSFHFTSLYSRVVFFISKGSGYFEVWQESIVCMLSDYIHLFSMGDFNLDESVYIRNLAP